MQMIFIMPGQVGKEGFSQQFPNSLNNRNLFSNSSGGNTLSLPCLKNGSITKIEKFKYRSLS